MHLDPSNEVLLGFLYILIGISTFLAASIRWILIDHGIAQLWSVRIRWAFLPSLPAIAKELASCPRGLQVFPGNSVTSKVQVELSDK